MIYAKQSTAIIVTVGPVLDANGVAVTDGVVGDFKISKNGGAPAALNASATLTHRNTGHYSLSLTATDVNTIGTAEVVIDDTVNACPMKEIHVLAANVYDSLFGAATDKLDVNVEEWNTTAVPAEHTSGYPIVTIKDGTGTGEINTNAGAVALVDLVTTTTTVTNQLTAAAIATGVWQDTTAGDFTVASSIGKSLYTSGAVPGAAGGLFIAGSNAATTTASLTTGAIAATTITASGAVAFQSTFAVTTSSSFGAMSCTTLTASGAVAFQSTFAVTTSTSLAALSATTITASGTTSLAAVTTSGTVTFNAFTVSGATTLTGNVSMAAGLNITQSSANTSALVITGNGTGHGAAITSGSGATGKGVQIVAASTNDDGMYVQGNGTGNGMHFQGGGTGAGLHAAGGGTSGSGIEVTSGGGNGINIAPTAGHGINIAANGSSKHGVLITGGTAGTSDGLKLVAGSGGVGLRGDTVTVSGTTTLAAVTTTGTVTFNAFTVSNATTLSGAVSLGSTLGVTGTTTLAAVNTGAIAATTFATSGTTTLNALTVTNATTLSGAVSLGSTLGVTGAITATNASNNLTLGTFTVTTNAIAWNTNWDAEVQSECADALVAYDGLVGADLPTNFAALGINASGHISRVTLVDTITTYTGNTVQTGDAFARLGAPAGASVSADLATIDDFLDTEIAAIKAKTDLLPEAPAKNTAFTYVVKMVDSTDHVTPKTGLTVTMTRSIDGAAFGAATGTVTEISTGHYKVVASAADMNGDVVTHRFTGTAADDFSITIVTTA